MVGVMPAATQEQAVDTARQVLVPVLSVAGGVLVALLLAVLLGVLVRSLARKSFVAADLARRAKRPLRALLVVIAVWVALRVSVPDETWATGWMQGLGHLLLIALIGAVTWLIGTLAFVAEDAALSRYRVDVKDNRHARRVRTQVQLLRRITVAVLVVVGLAAVLLTFPGVSAFGASLLASAGVLSVVAGLAAQSSLANVFAGLQIAFTDGIRVDDVVIVEQQWGRIEEITLTYVVVHLWDDRRLILPSTYFTQTPFENWTRRAAELLGTVELDVDWQAPVDDLRAELNRLLNATDLWDHRVGVLQVTDAVHGWVRLRALASAVDAPTLFDLRCYLREGLVSYLQRHAPQALPRTRIETTKGAQLPLTTDVPARGPAAGTAVPADPRPETGQLDARLFSGSAEAKQRAGSFAGPGQDVIAERESHAAESRTEAEPAPSRSSGGRRGDTAGTGALPVADVAAATAGATAAGAVPPGTGTDEPGTGTVVEDAARTGATPAAAGPDEAQPARDALRATEPAAAGDQAGAAATPAAPDPARGRQAGTDPTGTDPSRNDPAGTDPTGTDPASTDPARTGAAGTPSAGTPSAGTPSADTGAAGAPDGTASDATQAFAPGEPGTMVLPAFGAPGAGTAPGTDATQALPAADPVTTDPVTTDPVTTDPVTTDPHRAATRAGDEGPATPTRRSVRSAPITPRPDPRA
jgi:small-conductance mechanosensitive channel